MPAYLIASVFLFTTVCCIINEDLSKHYGPGMRVAFESMVKGLKTAEDKEITPSDNSDPEIMNTIVFMFWLCRILGTFIADLFVSYF